MSMDAQEIVAGRSEGQRPQPSALADVNVSADLEDTAAVEPRMTRGLDSVCQAILDRAKDRQRQTLEAQRIHSEAAARWCRAHEAWLHVALFKGENVPRGLHGPALWRHYAERIVQLGHVLREDGWQARLDAVRPGPDDKTYALGILRRAMQEDLEGVVQMLTGGGDTLFELGLEADQWLREGLMHEVLGIEPAPESPCGWEGSYFAPVETVQDFVWWIDIQFLEQDIVGRRRGDQRSNGSLVRDAFRLVTKLQLTGMPLEPLGPLTLHDELAVLRNLRRLALARFPKPDARDTQAVSVEDPPQACDPTSGPAQVPPTPAGEPVGTTPETRVAQYVAQNPDARMPEVKSVTALSESKIRRTQAWKDHEENQLDAYLQSHPDAGTPEVQQAFGFSCAKTVSMAAWKRRQERRAAANSPREPKTRPLNRATLACRAAEGSQDPAERLSQREEIVRTILEYAAPDLRARLNGLTDTDREALADHVVASLDGTTFAGRDSASNVQIVLEVVASWLDGHEQEKRHARRTPPRRAGG
jgi:hypothetical protein